MPHFGGLCFLVAFFLCSLSIQTKQKCFQRTIWGISSNQPIMWRFKRPSTCIKLHDSLNNSNNSHDYSIGSVIKVQSFELVSWKNFVKFWPYFKWEHIFIWINVNKERMRRKVWYGISNLFFFGCGIKCHLHAVWSFAADCLGSCSWVEVLHSLVIAIWK